MQTTDILPGTRVLTSDSKELGEVLGVDTQFIDVSPGEGDRLWRIPVVLADRMEDDRLVLSASQDEITSNG